MQTMSKERAVKMAQEFMEEHVGHLASVDTSGWLVWMTCRYCNESHLIEVEEFREAEMPEIPRGGTRGIRSVAQTLFVTLRDKGHELFLDQLSLRYVNFTPFLCSLTASTHSICT